MVSEPWQVPQLLYELYINREKSMSQIADELGCSQPTISTWIEKHGIKSRFNNKRTKAEELRDKSWLRKRYWLKGDSTTDIASELGVDASTVGYWLEKHGLGCRDRNQRPEQLESYEEMHQLYIQEDLSGREIADKLGCNHKAVYRWLDKHGLDKVPKPHRRQEANPLYKGASHYYGPNWDNIRSNIRERDEVCQGCGMSRTEHYEKWDKDLEVHHITPARKFGDDYESMNDPDNLVALCASCHTRWERIGVRPQFEG